MSRSGWNMKSVINSVFKIIHPCYGAIGSGQVETLDLFLPLSLLIPAGCRKSPRLCSLPSPSQVPVREIKGSPLKHFVPGAPPQGVWLMLCAFPLLITPPKSLAELSQRQRSFWQPDGKWVTGRAVRLFPGHFRAP